jgi:hypothetical protein
MKRGAVIVVLGLLVASPAFASMRCGSKIIDEGVTRSEVAAKCGELRSGQPPQRVPQAGRLDQRPTLLRRRGLHQVPIEAWIYNFGPNKLMRRVVFEAGVVVDIETLGYGYIK